jgi:hypothetical protein
MVLFATFICAPLPALMPPVMTVLRSTEAVTPVEKNSSAEVKVLSVTVATRLDGCSAKKCVTLWPTN